jgi:hypothetical protein
MDVLSPAGARMDIFNAPSTLTHDASLAFSKAPQRVVLLPGEELYRFGTLVSATFSGNDVFGSPWWIPAATYRHITKTAHRTGASIIDVARSGLAVSIPWNPEMDWLMVIALRKPVQAWIGPARPQPVSGTDRSALFLGNYEQAYVPGLASPGAMTSDAAVLMYFGGLER